MKTVKIRAIPFFLLFSLLGFGAEQAFLPIVFLSPENGLGVGGKWIARDPIPGWSRLEAHTLVTTRAQFEFKSTLRFGPHGYWGDPRIGLESYYTPYSYYGRGNDPAEAQKLIYEPLGLRFSGETFYPILYRFKVRLAVMGQAVRMQSIHSNSTQAYRDLILPPNTAGYNGGNQDLWESTLEWDGRDDEDLPRQGLHTGLKVGHSTPLSDFNYGKGELFSVLYWLPHPNIEWAAKALHRGIFGAAPFYDWPALGERKLLRGIPDRRLRDRQAEALQSEVRYTFKLALPLIASWFGDTWQIATFGEMGRVEKDFNSIMRSQWHPSGGVGGRLLVKHRLGALRGDLGFSGYGLGLYIDFNQAF
jgi:hypothetical protein